MDYIVVVSNSEIIKKYSEAELFPIYNRWRDNSTKEDFSPEYSKYKNFKYQNSNNQTECTWSIETEPVLPHAAAGFWQVDETYGILVD